MNGSTLSGSITERFSDPEKDPSLVSDIKDLLATLIRGESFD
jgi:hypothetical protein